MNNKDKSKSNKPTFSRPIEKYFYELDQSFNERNVMAISIFLFLLFFGVMGLIWMIPFPQFDFLIKINAHTFLNWGSIFIAIVIYSYLKLAPTLSYLVLFTIGIMSFLIVQLEYLERDGGPTVVFVCSIITLVGIVGLWLSAVKSVKQRSHFLSLLTIGPIWLYSKIFDKFNWKY